MWNDHYKEMLRALSDEKVKYLIIGAYALSAHGFVRGTVDMDLWVMPSQENAGAVMRALRRFGAPLFDLSEKDLSEPGTIFQIGVKPQRIDIITEATGLDFEETYQRSISASLEGMDIRIPCLDDLIRNKRATGRLRDLADVEELERIKARGGA